MSDSSSKDDRARWIVPIVVALIAALGVVIAAVAPSLFTTNDVPSPGPPATSAPPTVPAYQGEGTMRRADPQVDLDSLPNGTGGDNVGDLVHTPMALTTGKDSRIAVLDRAQVPHPDICRSTLAAHGTDAVPISQIETGVRLCISTTGGRTGAVTLDNVRKYGEAGQLRIGEVKFSYSMWNLPAR